MFSLAGQQRLEKFMPDDGGNHSYRQLVRSLKSARNETKLLTSHEITYLLEHRNGQWNLYPKPIYGLIISLNKASRYSYSYSYKNPWEQITPKTPKDRFVISHLRKMYEHDAFYGGIHGNRNEVIFGDVFELLQGETLKLKHDADGSATIHVNTEPFRFFLQIAPQTNGNSTPHSDLELQLLLKKKA